MNPSPSPLLFIFKRKSNLFHRFISPNSLNGVSLSPSPGVDSSLPIFPNNESRLKKETGRDNLAFGSEEVDPISPISLKSPTQVSLTLIRSSGEF